MGSAARSLPERVVLVVDDEEVICRMTARMLADAGFCALEAHSAEAALAMLASRKGAVQLVVSDKTMPGMDGVALAATVAAQWPTTPILLISGHGDPTGYPWAFLPKPFSQDALHTAVHSALARHPQAAGGV